MTSGRVSGRGLGTFYDDIPELISECIQKEILKKNLEESFSKGVLWILST